MRQDNSDPHGKACHPLDNISQAVAQEGVLSQHADHEHLALRWLPDWLPKIEKGPE